MSSNKCNKASWRADWTSTLARRPLACWVLAIVPLSMPVTLLEPLCNSHPFDADDPPLSRTLLPALVPDLFLLAILCCVSLAAALWSALPCCALALLAAVLDSLSDLGWWLGLLLSSAPLRWSKAQLNCEGYARTRRFLFKRRRENPSDGHIGTTTLCHHPAQKPSHCNHKRSFPRCLSMPIFVVSGNYHETNSESISSWNQIWTAAKSVPKQLLYVICRPTDLLSCLPLVHVCAQDFDSSAVCMLTHISTCI